MNSQEPSRIIATLDTLKNMVVGALPVIPGESRFGLDSISTTELTAALASHTPGARVERIRLEPNSKGTTDRGRLFLDWNPAGQQASLPTTVFAKGTPSTTSSRILNSAFGLCEFEVRFYNELHPAVAALTLKPLVARVGPGGRFVIAMEDLGNEAIFYQPGDEPPLAHAEAMMDTLALLHAKYWRSPRFSQDLRWITPFSRRPGFMLAHRVVQVCERSWLRNRESVPASVRRLTKFYADNKAALDRTWEAEVPTLCHGDSHLGNTYARPDGTAGIYDWQNLHKMHGMRDVAYFMGHALPIEVRRTHERNLIKRYLDALAHNGVGNDSPGFDKAFDLYRLFIIDGWTSVWASIAIGGMVDETRGNTLLERFYTALIDLDTEKALADAV